MGSAQSRPQQPPPIELHGLCRPAGLAEWRSFGRSGNSVSYMLITVAILMKGGLVHYTTVCRESPTPLCEACTITMPAQCSHAY